MEEEGDAGGKAQDIVHLGRELSTRVTNLTEHVSADMFDQFSRPQISAEGQEIVAQLDTLMAVRLQSMERDLKMLVELIGNRQLEGHGFACSNDNAATMWAACRPDRAEGTVQENAAIILESAPDKLKDVFSEHDDQTFDPESDSYALGDELPSARQDRLRRDASMKIAEDMANSFQQDEPETKPSCLYAVVYSNVFEMISAASIALNSLTLGAELQDAARNVGRPSPSLAFGLVRVCFSTFFIIELCMRIAADGIRGFFTSGNKRWNVFDLVLVLASLPELASDILSVTGQEAAGSINFSQLRLLRMMKVMRLIRVVRSPRIVRWMRPLQIMLMSIMYTMRSLAWILALFIAIVYMFSIVIVQAIVDRIQEVGVDKIRVDNPKLIEFWGDVFIGMKTLFKSVTGGISWHDVIVPLDGVDEWLWIVFFSYIFFILFCVFNVITGVFCNSAIEAAASDPELQAHYITQAQMELGAQIGVFFKRVDRDNSGLVTMQEFAEAVEDPKLSVYFQALGLGVGEAWELFKLMDHDGSQTVDIDEFVESCMKLKGGSSNVDMACVRREIQNLKEVVERDIIGRSRRKSRNGL